ncbi:MAG: efflux transporter outer membrane subunit [Desulfuromonadaceae bacterium]|nr:efflux transporter outer membrane subunit [Desulfuromonadaceae bacterium]
MRIVDVKAVLILLLCCGLTGCIAVGPDYQPPDLLCPVTWNRTGLADASAGGWVQGDASAQISQWWRTLDDALLTQLIDEALCSGLDLQTAQARLREARARLAVTSADFFPLLTASASASRSTTSGENGSGTSRHLYSAGFDASWELDLFGGVRRSVEAAEADLAAQEASLDDSRVTLAAEVASQYVALCSLQQRLAIARENLARQSETLQLTQWREQAGLANRQEVEQARSSMEQTRAQIPNLETSLATAEYRLDILLGQPPGTLHPRLAAGRDLPQAPPQLVLGIPAETVRQRPDVRAAEQALVAQTARVGVAEAALYPSFKLSGSLGLEALTLADLSGNPIRSSSLLGGITAPLLNAGQLRNQVRIQDALCEQARLSYQQTLLSALEEVENALVALSRNQDRCAALAAATQAAQQAAQLARQRYQAGLIDFQSVLETERSVLSLEDSLASCRADGILAVIQLYKALGGGWTGQTEPLTQAGTDHDSNQS